MGNPPTGDSMQVGAGDLVVDVDVGERVGADEIDHAR
jgi:hypothetical protein